MQYVLLTNMFIYLKNVTPIAMEMNVNILVKTDIVMTMINVTRKKGSVLLDAKLDGTDCPAPAVSELMTLIACVFLLMVPQYLSGRSNSEIQLYYDYYDYYDYYYYYYYYYYY